jgi:hypothetical protein
MLCDVRTDGDDFITYELRVRTIRVAIENGIKQYTRGDEFLLLMAAHVVVVSKRQGRFTRTARAIGVNRPYLLAQQGHASHSKVVQNGTTRSRRRNSSPRQQCNQNSDRRS